MSVKQTVLLSCFAIATNAVAQQNGDSIAELQSFEQYRIGGYGEMVAAFKGYGSNRFYGNAEGNPKTHRNTISIPRFVVAGDYKFSSKWVLGVEIEFESGGTGVEYELENSENGEYEMEVEKGGEVAIEQFHITRLIHPAFNVKAGHIVVPVGQNNAHHEPVTFFGTVRPEGETSIVPNTWHETGLEVFGQIGKGYASFNYEAMVVAGLNGNAFDRNNWAGQAASHRFEEDNFSQPGYAVRLNYTGVPGLRLGAAMYYCKNVGGNSDKEQTYKGLGKMPVRIYNLEGQYKGKCVEARANYLMGNLTNSDVLSQKNNKLSNKSPYSRITPIAHKAVAYGGEVGLNIRGMVNDMRCPNIIPFVRYEYYNAQEEGKGIDVMEPRLKTSMWVAGLNWRALPNLVVKADYTTRRIGGGNYNNENEFAIGAAFAGWFSRK